eukprot:296454-Pyramimonas_sp.AAC.1
MGPPTTQRCLDHVLRNAGGPLAWHSEWKAKFRWRSFDASCQHYDEVLCAEPSAFELGCGQIQLTEERRYEETVTAQAATEYA